MAYTLRNSIEYDSQDLMEEICDNYSVFDDTLSIEDYTKRTTDYIEKNIKEYYERYRKKINGEDGNT